jgi:hypothetical protein
MISWTVCGIIIAALLLGAGLGFEMGRYVSRRVERNLAEARRDMQELHRAAVGQAASSQVANQELVGMVTRSLDQLTYGAAVMMKGRHTEISGPVPPEISGGGLTPEQVSEIRKDAPLAEPERYPPSPEEQGELDERRRQLADLAEKMGMSDLFGTAGADG